MAYEKLVKGDMLRKLILDSYLMTPNTAWLPEHKPNLPGDFILDLACGWAEGIKKKDISSFCLSQLRPCTYHVHNEGAPKCG